MNPAAISGNDEPTKEQRGQRGGAAADGQRRHQAARRQQHRHQPAHAAQVQQQAAEHREVEQGDVAEPALIEGRERQELLGRQRVNSQDHQPPVQTSPLVAHGSADVDQQEGGVGLWIIGDL